MQFRTFTPPPVEMKQGAAIAYALRVHGVPLRWLTGIERQNPPVEFMERDLARNFDYRAERVRALLP